MEWEKLKNSPVSSLLWLEENAEPWQSLEIKNPSEEAYLYFFKNQKEFRDIIIDQKIKDIFLDNAKKIYG